MDLSQFIDSFFFSFGSPNGETYFGNAVIQAEGVVVGSSYKSHFKLLTTTVKGLDSCCVLLELLFKLLVPLQCESVLRT